MKNLLLITTVSCFCFAAQTMKKTHDSSFEVGKGGVKTVTLDQLRAWLYDLEQLHTRHEEAESRLRESMAKLERSATEGQQTTEGVMPARTKLRQSENELYYAQNRLRLIQAENKLGQSRIQDKLEQVRKTMASVYGTLCY